ncbi:MAG: hypothetical protein M1827_001394 [Pycnora praestabilis]|nr:MAG: hypothetical protein M1827_001394 [Pycnora praestabilis]
MADILSPQISLPATTQARQIPQRAGLKIPPPPSASLPPSVQGIRSGHLNLDNFSPVNQNGSFEFDRVLKSGEVFKRTRKTRTWKAIYLVLRPNLLSIYKDKKETQLRHKIVLSDLTAVAALKDPKQKRKYVFGLFSPSKNYHMQAPSKVDVDEWVELIRREARIDQEEEEMILASPGGHTGAYQGFERHDAGGVEQRLMQEERMGSSSPEPAEIFPRMTTTREGIKIPAGGRQSRHSVQDLDYSGNEQGSYSEFSDTPGPGGMLGSSSLSLSQQDRQYALSAVETQGPSTVYSSRPDTARNTSQVSGFEEAMESERVVWQGFLYYLKSKGGVRQWKELWVVLRPKNLAFYKTRGEYSATLIIPVAAIINAVDIDPISKSKKFCMQVISEERSYRFCAPSEDALAEWLGALKSLLAKRKDAERRRVPAAPAAASSTQ